MRKLGNMQYSLHVNNDYTLCTSLRSVCAAHCIYPSRGSFRTIALPQQMQPLVILGHLVVPEGEFQ